MTNEEFLRDVCPNHTDKSQWNKSELLHILDLHKEQLRLYGVVKSLPVDRKTALKVREDIINEHYKDDPNKSTFGLAFITCYDWLAKLCAK